MSLSLQARGRLLWQVIHDDFLMDVMLLAALEGGGVVNALSRYEVDDVAAAARVLISAGLLVPAGQNNALLTTLGEFILGPAKCYAITPDGREIYQA